MNKRKIGGDYEARAAGFLQKQGLTIKEKNYRCKMGEVDLVARDGKYLVFVEVKYRSDGRSGASLAAVDRKKRRVISRVAQYYLVTHYGTTELACRFDVVGFDGEEICWIPNAFDFCT